MHFHCLKESWLSTFLAKLVNVESPWIKTIDTQNFPLVLAEISSVAVHQSSLRKVLRHMLVAWKDGKCRSEKIDHYLIQETRIQKLIVLNPPMTSQSFMCLPLVHFENWDRIVSLSRLSLFVIDFTHCVNAFGFLDVFKTLGILQPIIHQSKTTRSIEDNLFYSWESPAKQKRTSCCS